MSFLNGKPFCSQVKWETIDKFPKSRLQKLRYATSEGEIRLLLLSFRRWSPIHKKWSNSKTFSWNSFPLRFILSEHSRVLFWPIAANIWKHPRPLQVTDKSRIFRWNVWFLFITFVWLSVTQRVCDKTELQTTNCGSYTKGSSKDARSTSENLNNSKFGYFKWLDWMSDKTRWVNRWPKRSSRDASTSKRQF